MRPNCDLLCKCLLPTWEKSQSWRLDKANVIYVVLIVEPLGAGILYYHAHTLDCKQFSGGPGSLV